MKNPIRLGILGGGQLARMISLEATALGIQTFVLSQAADDPAAQATGFWQKGDPSKIRDLKSFLKKIDVLTFESEFIDTESLRKANEKLNVPVHPNLKAIDAIQDRLFQKRLLDKFEIPTSPFCRVNKLSDAFHFFRTHGPLVLKKRRYGYDGYGTFIIKKESDLNELKGIVEENDHGFIAEKFIPFTRELATSFIRGKDKLINLPLVETKQRNSRCLWVKGPVQDRKLGKNLKAGFHFLLEKTNYYGILAVELFETPQGLIVNELAPRVHNSAHYSQNALSVSQFEFHARATLGLPIPKPSQTSKAFAMLNLLGESTSQPQISYDQNTHLHWYGKRDNRPGRKMGHINATGKTPENALKKCKSARKLVVL